jgi:YbgC/YbaW family acyl-CoA thioester hydrolase
MGFGRTQRVRYIECDAQRVVHNAHYLAWVDDIADEWFRQLDGYAPQHAWDAMVKKAEVTWSGSARMGDEVTTTLEATRFGTTSFDLTFTGVVAGTEIFVAVITYVAVEVMPGGVMGGPVPVPEAFKAAAVR